MSQEVEGIDKRFERAGIGLKDALMAVEMTLEDQMRVFEGLNELIGQTMHGARIESFRPQSRAKYFHTFEIHTESGETLGHLNMIYLRKPLPCYYLVYLEVVHPFRGRGLGNKILGAFRDFVEGKKAVGLLDNIIPPWEPTYDIYRKLGWKKLREVVANGETEAEDSYMVYIPHSVRFYDLRGKLVKLLFNLKKKRPVIEMHDNESMVKRTIEEFRSVGGSLQRLFRSELEQGASTPLMRYMFTKYVTALLGFERRISALLGYTGGESIDQITIPEALRCLPIQSHATWGKEEARVEALEEWFRVEALPRDLRRNPTTFIEALPLYRRPYLSDWIERKGCEGAWALTISDLLELGFDPTRLREFQHRGEAFIFERISPRLLETVRRRKKLLQAIERLAEEMRHLGVRVKSNPPLAIFQNLGNSYVLRKKVEGIHLDEALDQLKRSPYLRDMNREAAIDRTILRTVRELKYGFARKLAPDSSSEIEDLAFFVPWDIVENRPRLSVGASGVCLDKIWVL